MRPRLAAILLFLVVAPLAAMSWLGARVISGQEEAARRERDQLLTARLADTDAVIARLLGERVPKIEALLEGGVPTAAEARERLRHAPLVRQIFYRAKDGKLVYPMASAALTEAEREFLLRTRDLWLDKDVFVRPQESGAARGAGGPWYVYYWGNDINLVYWRREPDGSVRGAELDRVRFLADVIAALPATMRGASPYERIGLTDARGAVAYAWGDYHVPDGAPPRVRLALSPPLSGWSLVYFTAPTMVAESARLALIVGLMGLAVALIGLALYLYRESVRAARDAEQRVSFVNQVSHELKTPLTNIRMYAELLERDVGGDEAALGKHVQVIVSESQRLSRLIGNVLTFAREQRGALKLEPRVARVDDVVRGALDQFAPLLAEKGIAVSFKAGAEAPAQLDADVVRQILTNLFSNVEKYAASGGSMEVVSAQQGSRAEIVVADRGPGIPRAHAGKIFLPFYRVDNALTEGVSGTGIGLALARDLARLHGGDLTLEPRAAGAAFRLTLHAPTEAP